MECGKLAMDFIGYEMINLNFLLLITKAQNINKQQSCFSAQSDNLTADKKLRCVEPEEGGREKLISAEKKCPNIVFLS
jgi:hypothetical protein